MSCKLAIVLAEFNKEITTQMLKSATDRINELHIDLVESIKVPGSYEIPIVVHQVLEHREVDGVICLGFIEKGHTLHGEVMGNVIHSQLIKLQGRYGKPMGLGIIGPGATEEQARVRAVPYAKAAVDACYEAIKVIRYLKK